MARDSFAGKCPQMMDPENTSLTKKAKPSVFYHTKKSQTE
jgi:hypothetical protein